MSSAAAALTLKRNYTFPWCGIVLHSPIATTQDKFIPTLKKVHRKGILCITSKQIQVKLPLLLGEAQVQDKSTLLWGEAQVQDKSPLLWGEAQIQGKLASPWGEAQFKFWAPALQNYVGTLLQISTVLEELTHMVPPIRTC